jgi:hypothetical protein
LAQIWEFLGESADCWGQRRDEKLAESAVLLLSQIIRILTPLPFFRTSLIGVLNKILASQDPFHDLVSGQHWHVSLGQAGA